MKRLRKILQTIYISIIYWWRTRWIARRNPILIYQMGKVGSMTIEKSLRPLQLPNPSFHIHTLSASRLAFVKNQQKKALSGDVIAASFLVKALRKGTFPCKIITLTREPIERSISFVFENLTRSIDGKTTFDKSLAQQKVTTLLQSNNGHANPGHWFDRELKKHFDIDVFSNTYNFEQGYQIIKKGNVSVLIIRMEDLNSSLQTALNDFFQLKTANFALQRANTGANKWYAKDLSQIKTQFKLPAPLVDSIIQTHYFQHFYANDATRVKQRWSFPSQTHP